MKNFADVDSGTRPGRSSEKRSGRKTCAGWTGRILASVIERGYEFWSYRPDISFLPEKERLKPEEIGYYTWDFVWVVPGKEGGVRGRQQGMDRPQQGQEGTGFLFDLAGEHWALGCRSMSGSSTARAPPITPPPKKSSGRRWGRRAPRFKKTRALIQRMDSKTGQFRPDLSYTPKSK